jgi:hypothetical protein
MDAAIGGARAKRFKMHLKTNIREQCIQMMPQILDMTIIHYHPNYILSNMSNSYGFLIFLHIIMIYNNQ